ncbi:MAG: hypothetical protein JOS17DRAFT_747014 [Linnemannia elongata]|nr:MAG: hypothetical protein JOS17DRAFT_747014 [Linnemannia elongata]
MNTHPLSLYEIVLAIGKFIPLWESCEHSSDEDIWYLKPKDLIAAISVNRHFHATLTPLLWSVYVESAVKSLEYPNWVRCGFFYHHIPFDIVQKNSSYIRFLDLSDYHPRYTGTVELLPLDLNFSRLQELRLSDSVDCTWAKRIILAHPELRVLHWVRTRKKIKREEVKDFESVLSLRRLRYLGLDGWWFFTQQLYGALANNAEHLEELRLTRCHSIIAKWSKKDDTGKLRIAPIASMEKGGEEFEPLKRMCWRIRLEKLKALHLDVEHNLCPLTLYWLVNVVPALETIVFGDLLGNTAKALSLTLRKSCPRLQTIKLGHIWEVNSWRPHQHSDALYLTNACAPGHLVHASLDGWRIDNANMEALSLHRDSLETLELAIRDDDYRDSFSNLGTILERCSRLKHLSVYFFRYGNRCDRRQPLLFLDKLATCSDLVRLEFHGFTLADDNNHLDDTGSDEGALRVRIDRNQELDDYGPEANGFGEPGWRELFLGGFLDMCEGECCDHFKRLVCDAIGSLSSLKCVVFGVTGYVKVLSSSS